MLEALLTYRFLQNAVTAGLLASVVCGIIGVIIVEKKLVMMSGGIAHTAYGGVGLGYLLGIEPMIGAFLFAVASAFGIGYVKRKGSVQSDVLIGLFWSLGMALGIVFIAMMPGYPPDMNSYLFGNILSVTRADLYLMVVLSVIVVAIVTIFFQLWKVYLFDDEFSGIIGIKSAMMEYVLLVLVALTIVVLIRVAGIILVLALLTAPAATAGLFSKNLKSRMLLAIGFGIFFSLTGLAISYSLNIASGASIVIVSVVFCFGASFLKGVAERRKREEQRKQG